jgi:hypothetical protein
VSLGSIVVGASGVVVGVCEPVFVFEFVLGERWGG